MFTPSDFDLVDLDHIIESYDYATDPLLKNHFHLIEQHLCEKIENYGEGVNDYGSAMMKHLQRTSQYGSDFLIHIGFSHKAANNFYHANLLQDLGKIHPAFDVGLWSLPHRPSDEERAEKRLHVPRGPEVFKDSLYSKAVADEMASLFSHPHISIVIPAIQLFHHERIDGKGPYGKTGDEMGKVIKTACIVDAKDGDMIPRPHQEHGRGEEEALDRMKNGEKYQGAFDGLLDKYARFRGVRL